MGGSKLRNSALECPYAQALTLAALPELPLVAMAGALEAVGLVPEVASGRAGAGGAAGAVAILAFQAARSSGSACWGSGSARRRLFSTAVAGSTGVVGALLVLERLSRSSTHWTVCATAVSALVPPGKAWISGRSHGRKGGLRRGEIAGAKGAAQRRHVGRQLRGGR